MSLRTAKKSRLGCLLLGRCRLGLPGGGPLWRIWLGICRNRELAERENAGGLRIDEGE